MKNLGIIAGALALGACATYEPTQLDIARGMEAAAPESLEASEQAAQAYFSQSLFDPDSALMRVSEPINSHMAIRGEGAHGWFMCGELNAKNRMGGYVGYRPFWVYFDPADPLNVLSGNVDSYNEYYAQGRCEELEVNKTGVAWKAAGSE
jgi:hypothetical protein